MSPSKKEGSFEAGHVLTEDEQREMLAYDDAKQPRPDRYDDVVFDASSPQGTVYRVKTAEEKRIEEESAESTRRASEEREAARVKVLEEAGIDAATGGRLAGVRNVVGSENNTAANDDSREATKNADGTTADGAKGATGGGDAAAGGTAGTAGRTGGTGTGTRS